MNLLKSAWPFAKRVAPAETESEERSEAGTEKSVSRRSKSSGRSQREPVFQECDVFSISNEPATEFEEAPAPVPDSVRTAWRILCLLTAAHAIILVVNIVLLFHVHPTEKKSHQQILLFALLMLTNIAMVSVLGLVIVRQNKALTQCGICCAFWTTFSYFVILAYNSLDDPLSLTAGRTCLTVIIVTLLELAALALYFVLRFIRYKKVVELYNCRACKCDQECAADRSPTRLTMQDLWPKGAVAAPSARPTTSASVAETTTDGGNHASGGYQPTTHYM